MIQRLIRLFAVTLVLWGCSSSSDGSGPAGAGHDCPSACQAAQAKNCTSISGDCSAFCNAADAVATAANCVSAKDAYLNCTIQSPVCTSDSKCSSQKTAFANCAAGYCAAHTSDTSCVTLVGSL